MGPEGRLAPVAVMEEFLAASGGVAVLDGGLATELEARGADLHDSLWSAKCLFESPHLIKEVHLDYLEAGASVLITASYQATLQGFQARGFSHEESESFLRRSVEIAQEARDEYLQKLTKDLPKANKDDKILKKRPILIAASVGSYGAYLADGSEYSGEYGKDVTLQFLKDFHKRRLQVLIEAGPDIIVFEAIPSKTETQAYIELLGECDIEIPAWFAFSSRDGVNIASGDSMVDIASIVDKCRNAVAIGANCCPPSLIHPLISLIRKATKKPILIYPNSGECYDPIKKEWVASSGVHKEDFVSYVSKWRDAGASIIGGCCRTTPETIRAISRALGGEAR